MPRLLPDGPFSSSRSAGVSAFQERARWPEWTQWRLLAAYALVLASVVGSLVLASLALYAASCGVFGGYCTPAEVLQLRVAVVAAPLTLMAGPSVVAGLRRRPVWVVVPAVVLALLGLSLAIAMA